MTETAGTEGFFEDAPPPRPRDRPDRAWDRPADVLPAVVPASVVLARNADVAVAVTGFWVYPNGFELFVLARLREPPSPAEIETLFQGPGLSGHLLRFGVLFANGQKATNLTDHYGGRIPDQPPTGPVLRTFAAAGGSRFRDWRNWIWPLPPAGPLTLVCEWPAYGVPECRAEVDAGPIRAAAGAAIALW